MKKSTEQIPLPTPEKDLKPVEFIWLTTINEERKKQGIKLTPKPEEIYAYIVYASPLPETLSDIGREKLSKQIGPEGKEYWICGFGEFDLDKALQLEPNQPPSLSTHMERRAAHENISPIEINLNEVADIIKDSKTIIYTGAGISVAAGTPDMDRLLDYLGIDRTQAVDEFARMLMFSPEVLQNRLQGLQESFFEKTTQAHESLAQIQQVTGVKIVTENLDMLGEAAGQDLIKREDIEIAFPDSELQQLEYIVTIGLRSDDSSLLWRFREVNPEGRIIALNIEPPPYLDGHDYYLEGDAQQTVPQIAQMIKTS